MRGIFTDLAMERHAQLGRDIDGVNMQITHENDIETNIVQIENESGAQAIGRPCGTYITLSCEQQMHWEPKLRDDMSRALSAALAQMIPEKGDILLVGLGNRRVTADALGPRVADATLVTRHMREQTPESLAGRMRTVSVVSPGVLGVTGMETAEVVKGVVDHVKPSAVIAVDALAARDSSRICSTVQISNTGISPGSGVGNHRRGLTQETLGVPVIAIGVPMVVYASTIARDALGSLVRDVTESPSEIDAMEEVVDRIVTQSLGEMVVTPREVDALIEHMSGVLSKGINIALQASLDEAEISALMQ